MARTLPVMGGVAGAAGLAAAGLGVGAVDVYVGPPIRPQAAVSVSLGAGVVIAGSFTNLALPTIKYQ